MKPNLKQDTTFVNSDLDIFQTYSNRAVFVRDLPFACTSQTLKDFFTEKLGECVEKALVCENRRGRNLQFGCVLFEKEENVQQAIDALNSTRLQGRDVRIMRFDPAAPSESSSTGSIHVSFKTLEQRDQLTEEDLQEVFSQFGDVEHVSIRSLKYSDDGMQGGYGFLSFKTEEENKNIVEVCYQRVIDGVIFDCQWSQKNTDRQKARSDRAPSQKLAATASAPDKAVSTTISNNPGAKSIGSNRKEKSNRSSTKNISGRKMMDEVAASSSTPNYVESTPSLSHQATVQQQQQYFPQVPMLNVPNTSSFTNAPAPSQIPQQFSPIPGFASSPTLAHYSPISTPHISHQVIQQQQYPLPPQQYYYSTRPSSSVDVHQSPVYIYQPHQISPTISPRPLPTNGFSPRSSVQQSPVLNSSVPHTYMIPMQANQPQILHGTNASQPPSQQQQQQYSPTLHHDEMIAYGVVYSNPTPPYHPLSQGQTSTVNDGATMIVATNMGMNLPPPYYPNYYSVNSPIPISTTYHQQSVTGVPSDQSQPQSQQHVHIHNSNPQLSNNSNHQSRLPQQDQDLNRYDHWNNRYG